MANIIENRLNRIRNMKNTSETIKNRIGKQHNIIPNLILAVITPHRGAVTQHPTRFASNSRCQELKQVTLVKMRSPLIWPNISRKLKKQNKTKQNKSKTTLKRFLRCNEFSTVNKDLAVNSRLRVKRVRGHKKLPAITHKTI